MIYFNFSIISTILYADQGVNIACVNMKNLLDKNYKIHKFYFDVMTFKYLMKIKTYIEIQIRI